MDPDLHKSTYSINATFSPTESHNIDKEESFD